MLELTAPGQLGGDLSELEAQKAWQFEVGHPRARRRPARWDVAVYDIELWDEIRNVNVQPFPVAPFTIPRFQNIDRSRHTGVEAGGDVLLVEDLAARVGLGSAGDRAPRSAPPTRGRASSSSTIRPSATTTFPARPSTSSAPSSATTTRSGFWVAPGMEVVPTATSSTARTRDARGLHARQRRAWATTCKPWNLSVYFEARNLTDITYTSSVVVDSANGRFFEPGDGRAFYGGVAWRWKSMWRRARSPGAAPRRRAPAATVAAETASS